MLNYIEEQKEFVIAKFRNIFWVNAESMKKGNTILEGHVVVYFLMILSIRFSDP